MSAKPGSFHNNNLVPSAETLLPLIQADDLEHARKNRVAIALLDAWALEDSHMSDAERRKADADTADFKRNINLSRAEEGRPPAYS